MNQIFIKSKVKHIAKVYSGATPKTENPEFWNGDVLWITPNDLSKLKGAFFTNTERKITTLGLNSCSAHLLPKGTLVMSSRAPIGYLAIAMDSFATNQGCKSLVFDNKNDSLFFYYNFHWHIDKLKQLGEGTTFAEISKSYLEEFEITYPPSLPEQTRIAQILSQADEAIAHTEALIAKYQRIKTGLMQDLLTRGIDPQGQIRSEATHPFKDSPLGRIPVEWEVMTLGEVYRSIKSGSTPLRENKSYFEDGHFCWVKTLDMNEDYLYDTQEKITKKALSETSCTLFPKNTVLVAMYGGWEQIGRTSILGETAATNQAITALYNPALNLLPELTQYCLQYFRYKWKVCAVSTRKDPNISKNDIQNFCIVFPKSEDEQLKIVSVLNSNKQKIKDLQSHLTKLQSMKRGLMQDLLSGRVRVGTPQTNEP